MSCRILLLECVLLLYTGELAGNLAGMFLRIAVFLLVATLAGAQAAKPPADRPASRSGGEAFDAGLKAAQDAALHGRAKVARDQLAGLLQSHQGEDYVFARKTEIAEL